MRTIRWLIILVLIAIALWRLAPEISSISSLIKYIDKVQTPWLILTVVSQAGQYFGSGWLSQVLLKIAGYRINLKNTFLISCLNVFAAHILPVGDAGMIAATFYFYRKLGVQTGSIIFLALLWPIFGGVVLLSLFLSSLFYLPKPPTLSFHPSFITLTTASVATIIGLILFWGRKTILNKLILFVARFSFFEEIRRFKNNLPIYKKNLSHNKLYAAEGLLSAFIYYLSNIATLVLSFVTFGNLPPVSVIIFAYTLSLVAGWITFAPAGIGAAEATLILVFLHFNIDATLTIAAVLVFRLITFWLPIPFGALAFKILMKKDKSK
ncbi:flippase-like domain-containing protein [Candidatus Curtissbacteria bacterium]|nr:flippase-like domain-containing protein [Candidatus Curtissbacteria bacterium]